MEANTERLYAVEPHLQLMRYLSSNGYEMNPLKLEYFRLNYYGLYFGYINQIVFIIIIVFVRLSFKVS